MDAAVELDSPERRRVAALASERHGRSREKLEVAPCRVTPLADVAMPVHDERGARLGEHLGEGARVVEPHPDFGGCPLSDAQSQRDDVVMEQHDAVPSAEPFLGFREVAQPIELGRTNRSVFVGRTSADGARRSRGRPESHRPLRAIASRRRTHGWRARRVRRPGAIARA